MKNSLLGDLEKIYNSIKCDNEFCRCSECSNKRFCHKVYYLMYRITDFYPCVKKSTSCSECSKCENIIK